MNQKQTQKQSNRRYTFEEYSQVMQDGLKDLSCVLFKLESDLSKGLTDPQAAKIHENVSNFVCNELNLLIENLKKSFY